MRTNIEIDDGLMAQAMDLSGLPTKRATVEEALKILIQRHSLKRTLQELEGIGWEGDLEEMRLSFGGHAPR